jgi:hypothetical protein
MLLVVVLLLLLIGASKNQILSEEVKASGGW